MAQPRSLFLQPRVLQLQETPIPLSFCGSEIGALDETERSGGPGTREGCSSFPPPFLLFPSCCAVAETLQQTPLGPRLRQGGELLTRPGRAGSQPHPLGCLGGEGRHPNDLAAQKSPSRGLRQLRTRTAPFPRPGMLPGAGPLRSLPTQESARAAQAGVGC